LSITTTFLASSHVAVRNLHFFTKQQDNFEVNRSALFWHFSKCQHTAQSRLTSILISSSTVSLNYFYSRKFEGL
jgi:hypothetical protein